MTRKSLKTFILTSSLLLLSFVSGCGPFWVDPYITVKDSPLNWVNIHYYNLRSKPIRRTGVCLWGSGLVELRKGTSELVSNDFAKRYTSEEWDGIATQRVQIDPKHVKDLFQNLVNYGLLDREKWGKHSKRDSFDRFIAVKANIDTYTFSEQDNIFEVDPDLAEQLLDVIREFDNPLLRTRSSSVPVPKKHRY